MAREKRRQVSEGGDEVRIAWERSGAPRCNPHSAFAVKQLTEMSDLDFALECSRSYTSYQNLY